MKKNRWTRLFCVLFVLLCLLPSVGMLFWGQSEAASHEVLARKPSLMKSGSLNTGVLSDAASWFHDHFALRQEMVTAHAAVTAAVFRESASRDVILGREGWLYYGDTLADYEGTAPMTQRQIWAAAHTLALMQEYAQTRGSRFVFTVAPNKNSLYPENMPARYARSAAASNLERLTTALEREGVVYCDLLAALRQAQTPVYYQTDSHWTGYGSALAHDALMETLGREERLAGETFVPAAHSGDLYAMLYPAGRQTEQGLALERPRTFSYVGTVHGSEDMTIRTTCNGQTGSLLMFRDSFGNALHSDLAERFAAACFSRAMPYDLTCLAAEQADTLVIELVERDLLSLATQPPVFPGPVRELPVPEETVPAQVRIETEESAVERCVHYTGTVQCAAMDADSPVYVLLDGVIYEAAPAGTAEGAFSLHAPAAEEAAVLVVTEGRLVLCDSKT